jgi:hypothetical protein
MTAIYHGYTETDEQVQDRMNRRNLANVEATYGADWEATADALREQVELLDTLDWVGDDGKWDFTPMPKDMPILDLDKIDEIPF